MVCGVSVSIKDTVGKKAFPLDTSQLLLLQTCADIQMERDLTEKESFVMEIGLNTSLVGRVLGQMRKGTLKGKELVGIRTPSPRWYSCCR